MGRGNFPRPDFRSSSSHRAWCRKAKSWVPKKAGKLQQTLHQHSGSLLSIDLVGPLRRTTEHQNCYVLTMMDALSHLRPPIVFTT